LASGEIVAYTDDDCEVDIHWLRYLVQAMQDQDVEAIGGPNITPSSDGWVAKCVAASPGNPSHVMLNDTHAEHVPGCNMAFRRRTLIDIGGFDPQFRVAGDDVDICWRLLDAGLRIGYAPGAMVWHHRRATLKAYAKQQKGYGRSEALVHFKHPQRFGPYGRSKWQGIIYGDGAVGLPLLQDRIYHGQFGNGLFQIIYRHNHYGLWSVVMSLEWHFAAIFLVMLGLFYWPVALLGLGMWAATIASGIRSGYRAPLKREAPWWCRPVVCYLYVMQPIWRGWYRLTHLLLSKHCPQLAEVSHACIQKKISGRVLDLYWNDQSALGREHLLEQIVENARKCAWAGDFQNAWDGWDLKLVGDCWHYITITTATEELGWPRRFTRARCELHPTQLNYVIAGTCVTWSLTALLAGQNWAVLIGTIACILLLIRSMFSRRQCLTTVTRLLAWASADAGLGMQPVSVYSGELVKVNTEDLEVRRSVDIDLKDGVGDVVQAASK
jgi:hypothetical protein